MYNRVMEHSRFKIEITDVSDRGEGIGKADGLAVFVPGTLPGDIAEVEITEDKGRFAKAKLISLAEPSKDRVEPACQQALECGGCPLMGLSYDAQLKLKEKHVHDALTRIAGLEDPKINPIIAADNPYHYRNKGEFAVDMEQIGYYKASTHKIVQAKDCLIQDDLIMDALAEFSAELSEKPRKNLKRVTIRSSRSGETMLICEYRNGDKTASTRVLHDEITTDMGTLKTEVSPLSFYQVNPAQCSKLYSKVQEYAELTGEESVLDLYCGAGSIGLSMASKAKKIIGVEVVKDAVIDANRNAVINGIVNDQFICGKAEEVLPAKLQGVHADVVILDPPRNGCDSALLESVCSINCRRLIYVSCNPATLARDLKYLTANGFRFVEATPCDMFPQSLHTECIVLMMRS